MYSQLNEEQKLHRIFEIIGVKHFTAVEFGAGDGFTYSNTRALEAERDFQLFMFDREPGHPSVFQADITCGNVEEVFRLHHVPHHFDLLSLDIDGNDFWVWQALKTFRPRVVVIEFNQCRDGCMTIKENPAHAFASTDYYGATYEAMKILGDSKRYLLVDRTAWNMIFVAFEDVTGELGLAEPWVFDPQLRGWGGDRRGLPWVEIASGFDGDDLLRRHFDNLVFTHAIDTIVETGTWKGGSTRYFAGMVKKVVSYEVNASSHAEAQEQLKGLDVDLRLGNSGDELYAGGPDEKVLYFLDAHWYNYCPLLDELRIIAAAVNTGRPKPVIVIHDFKVPGTDFGFDTWGDLVYDWPHISEMIEAIGPRYEIHYPSEVSGAMRGYITITWPQ